MNLANGVASLSVGRRRNGAGVDDDNFGITRTLCKRTAPLQQLAFYSGAVGLCRSATKLLNVEGTHTAKGAYTNLSQRLGTTDSPHKKGPSLSNRPAFTE
jgi:hypothetical protein